MDRKVVAIVEGILDMPVRVSREVIINIDCEASASDVDDALRQAAQGEIGGEKWETVDASGFTVQDDYVELECQAEESNEANLRVDNVMIEDSK